MTSRTSARRSKPDGDLSYSHSKRLSIPRESAKNSEWARFAADATALLFSGSSLATALGDDVDVAISSPEELVHGLLTVREKEMYSHWKKGSSPPRADWKRLRTALSGTTSAQRARWNDLTDALRVLYADSTITPENCKAWVEKYNDNMPLLIATKKVETARRDARYAKGSKAARDVREIAACRRLISEVGKQRIRSNTMMKKLNREAGEREADLVKRLNKLDNGDEPRDKDSALKKLTTRESYWAKLTKTRTERVETGALVARQNADLISVEKALQNRLMALEERMRAERRRQKA